MTEATELQGVDFDWFAVDAEGKAAIFATAGSGVVPSAVLQALDVHENFSKEIDTPNWGNDAVWDDYANVGLYVFDWRDDSYLKIRSPSQGVKGINQGSSIDASKLPRLEVNFDLRERIREDVL